MIYQLQQYLETEFPNEKIFANLTGKISPELVLPDRIILLIETTSTIEPRTGFSNKGIQVMVRDIDSVKARKLANSIFDFMNDKYSITLTPITVDGDVYPAVEVLQISANADPQSIGYDENGLAEFSINFRILYRRV